MERCMKRKTITKGNAATIAPSYYVGRWIALLAAVEAAGTSD